MATPSLSPRSTSHRPRRVLLFALLLALSPHRLPCSGHVTSQHGHVTAQHGTGTAPHGTAHSRSLKRLAQQQQPHTAAGPGGGTAPLPPEADTCARAAPGSLSPPLRVQPDVSKLSWRSSGALNVSLSPRDSFPVSGFAHTTLSSPQAVWEWQCGSFSRSLSGEALRFTLFAPGLASGDNALIDINATNVYLTVSGGNFTTDPKGNFTFTPQSAAILIGRATGRYFSAGDNIDISNLQYPFPGAQIPAVSGSISATSRSIALYFETVTNIGLGQVLAGIGATAGILGLVGDTAVQFTLSGNATGPTTAKQP